MCSDLKEGFAWWCFSLCLLEMKGTEVSFYVEIEQLERILTWIGQGSEVNSLSIELNFIKIHEIVAHGPLMCRCLEVKKVDI